MKKYLLLFIIATISFNESKAQYHPMLGDTTEWCLAWNFMPVRSSSGMRTMENHTYTAMTDTTYDSLTYKKVFSDLVWYFGAVREDTAAEQVYFIKSGDTVEHLIYDFSLNLGDLFVVDLYNNYYNNLYDGIYTVDSVSFVNIRGGLRKYIRLHNPANTNLGFDGNPLKLEWIESLGDIHNPIYTYAYDGFGDGMIQMYCNNTHESSVLKQTINAIKNHVDICAATYVSGDVDSDTCTVAYWGSVEELNNSVSLTLYPNPANGNSVTIDVNNYTLKNNCEITLTDAMGRIVYSTLVNPVGNSITITDLKLITGVYFVNLSDKKAVFANTKFVVNDPER